MTPTESYHALIAELREIDLLCKTEALLGWDQQTHLPAKGTEFRAKQKSMLAGMIHQRWTSEKFGDWLSAAESSDLVADPNSDAAVNVRQTRRIFERDVKLPEELVRERTKLSVMAHQAWVDARKKADFAAYAPWLQKTVTLVRREAECVGYSQHPYDALLDEYEPGDTTADLRGVFDELRGPLVELVGRIAGCGRTAPTEILERSYPVDLQEKLARQASAAIGFDFQAGRLDVSVHPMCSELGPLDTRLTTRYDEHSFGDCFFSVLHETGHGLYQQGLPPEHYGTPCGQPVSLGIHESQSRLWENLVGRSRPFWRFFLPKLKDNFGSSLAGVNEEQWYAAINDVRPSLIRVESDEATYNLHVLLRFELEQAMVTGELAAADVSEAWNEKMRKYLGLTPPDAAQGALQDIHWSLGAIGYFPTYTLGNLYAAQFFEQAGRDLGDLDGMLGRGDFTPLLQWLRKNIHSQGQRHKARELVQRVTGQKLSARAMLAHLNRKAAEVYGVSPVNL
jgi:carboxypeptidase Taq